MAVERYCEIRNEQIRNTVLVDPETDEGQDYLLLQEANGVVLIPEADALAHPYPYWTPPQ